MVVHLGEFLRVYCRLGWGVLHSPGAGLLHLTGRFECFRFSVQWSGCGSSGGGWSQAGFE